MILGLDTSTPILSVALMAGEVRLVDHRERADRTHAARVAMVIDEVLGTAGVSPQQLEAIGVGVGPGSFTGIRIGVATAEGMALAVGIPAIGFSSLEGFAVGVSPVQGRLVALSDARRGRVYTSEFVAAEGEWKRQSEDHMRMLDELLDTLRDQEVTLVGDPCRQIEAPRRNWTLVPEVGAASLAALAGRRVQEGAVGERPDPCYLRGPVE